jgi:hypothetical protein
MFRATCDCANFNISRVQLMPSWVNRKCKKCKSNLKVYSGGMLVFDYNIASERAKSRGRNYLKVKNGKIVMPRFIQLPPAPPPSPIIRDVFMGFEPTPFSSWEPKPFQSLFGQPYVPISEPKPFESIFEDFQKNVKSIFEQPSMFEQPLFGQSSDMFSFNFNQN